MSTIRRPDPASYRIPVEWLSPDAARDGMPIALFHGLLSCSAVWGGDDFREIAAAQPTVAFPLPGHPPWSMSPLAAANLFATPDALIDCYADALRAAFCGRPARLIGHSSGALIALEIARLHPDLVADVFVFGAIGSGKSHDRSNALRHLLTLPVIGKVALWSCLAWWLTCERRFAAGLRTAMASPHESDAPWPAMRRALRQCNTGILQAFGHWLRRRDLFRVCKDINVPVCVLLCAADPVSSPSHQLRLLRALPDAHALIVNVGHLPNFESPRLFSGAIRSWLRGSARPATMR